MFRPSLSQGLLPSVKGVSHPQGKQVFLMILELGTWNHRLARPLGKIKDGSSLTCCRPLTLSQHSENSVR